MFHNIHDAQFNGGEYNNVGRDLHIINHYYGSSKATTSSAKRKNAGELLADSSCIDNVQMIIYVAMKTLLEHISPGAFHNSADRHDPPRCHPRTRQAVLSKIMKWARDPQNLRLLMWIYGPAGAGKSAIMQTIAELCQEEGILGASFFFFRTADKRNIKTHLIATLVYQLTLRVPILSDHITAAILCNPSIFSQTLEAQMKILIIDPMIAILSAYPHVSDWRYIVLVDGLDECSPENSHREIITILCKSAFSPFRIIIASRPEYVIRTTFSLPFMLKQIETLALDNDYHADKDIQSFLRDKFNELRTNHPQGRHLPTSWPAETAIKTLVHNASGQFIYAATVMKFLNSPRHNPIKALEAICHTQLSANPPHTPFGQLDALYHHVLGAVQDIEKVLNILYFMVLSTNKSLCTSAAMETVLGYSNGELYTILCDMHSLLDIPEDTNQQLRFYHTSLGDFLRDPLRAQHLYISLPNSNAFISACFAQNLDGMQLFIKTYILPFLIEI